MALSNPYLQVEHLTKSFGDRLLFQNISFGVAERQRVAIIARNGMGKTTLLNIIAGEQDYDEGSITFRRDLRVGYLRQKPEFPPEMTVLEACMQNAPSETELQKSWDYETRYKQILGKLKIHHLDQPVGQLSGGQLKRVALANVLIQDPQLLILDEPTNHLDLEMVEWLEDFLRRSSMSLLMVTHDRYFLDRVCSDILEIDQQQLFAYRGNYSYYLQKREERIQVWNAETETVQNLYRTELDWMRRMPQARGHKSRSRIDNFYLLEERAKQRLQEEEIKLEINTTYIGSKIFEAKYINKVYPAANRRAGEEGDLIILKDFYYNFGRYEKMGIVGNNGTGKSTFLKLLLGMEQPDSGSFDIGQTVRFGYYRQEGLQFDDRMKVIDVVRNIAEDIDMGGGKHLKASQFLQHFLFSPEQQNNYVAKLSGGEKQRLHLCTVLIQNPNFLILDEPTNDLDIVTLNILENYLRAFKGCLIVVSHDRYFMDKVVDHLLVFKGQGVVKDFPGNYTQYREAQNKASSESNKSESNKEESKPVKTTVPKSTKADSGTERKKLTYKEQQEFKQLEARLPELEAEKAQLEQQMSGLDENGQPLSAEFLQQASERYQQVSSELDDAEMRWLELSERN